MAWAHLAASGTRSVVVTDDLTADKISRMNSEVYDVTLSDQNQPNAAKLTGHIFIL